MSFKLQTSNLKNIVLRSFNFLVCFLMLFIYFEVGSLLFEVPAFGWRITPELQKELSQKQAAVNANPKDPVARFDLAITMAYTNNIPDGWNNLKKTVELDPSFRQKGLALFIQKVTENPNDWRLRFRLAFTYYFNDKKTDAIRELNNVLILDPGNVWAFGYIALIYGEIGNVDATMDYTRKGIKIDSNVAALHLLLSEGYYKKNNSWQGLMERLEALRLKALGY